MPFQSFFLSAQPRTYINVFIKTYPMYALYVISSKYNEFRRRYKLIKRLVPKYSHEHIFNIVYTAIIGPFLTCARRHQLPTRIIRDQTNALRLYGPIDRRNIRSWALIATRIGYRGYRSRFMSGPEEARYISDATILTSSLQRHNASPLLRRKTKQSRDRPGATCSNPRELMHFREQLFLPVTVTRIKSASKSGPL